MDTTTMTRPAAGTASGGSVHFGRSVVHLEESVDRLAELVESLLVGADEFVCSLEFDEAEALAEMLEAGDRTATAARLMHRWVLTEPDWADDEKHFELLRRWLELSVRLDGAGSSPASTFAVSAAAA